MHHDLIRCMCSDLCLHSPVQTPGVDCECQSGVLKLPIISTCSPKVMIKVKTVYLSGS